MSNFKLYEYTENYENLLEVIEDNPDLDSEGIKDALDAIQEDAKEKVFNTAGFIKKLEDDLQNIKDRRKELQEMANSKSNAIESIKSYLLEHMIRMDIKKVDNGTRVVRYQNNPPKLHVKKIDLVPKKYKTQELKLDFDIEKLPKKYEEFIMNYEERVRKTDLLRDMKKALEKAEEGTEEHQKLKAEYDQYAEIEQTQSVRIK